MKLITTTLQERTRQRNWEIGRIKGACANLKHLIAKHGNQEMYGAVDFMEQYMINRIKRIQKSDKQRTMEARKGSN